VTDILNAAIWLVCCTFAAWTIRRTIRAARRVGDYRSRNDQRAAWHATRLEHRPEPGHPGTDTGLLIDAYLTYYGPAGLDRLRDAIEQHRKEKP